MTLEKRCRGLPIVMANVLVIVTSRYLNKSPNADRVVLPPHFTELVLWETGPELARVKTYDCTLTVTLHDVQCTLPRPMPVFFFKQGKSELILAGLAWANLYYPEQEPARPARTKIQQGR